MVLSGEMLDVVLSRGKKSGRLKRWLEIDGNNLSFGNDVLFLFPPISPNFYCCLRPTRKFASDNVWCDVDDDNQINDVSFAIFLKIDQRILTHLLHKDKYHCWTADLPFD